MSGLVDISDIVNDNLLMSSWVATERYGLSVAPGGLALVQNLLNTRAIVDKGADLLSDVSAAQTWVPAAASAWSAGRGHTLRAPTLTESDVARLRDLREMLSSWVGGEPTARTGAISPGLPHSLSVTVAKSSGRPPAADGDGGPPRCGVRFSWASAPERGGGSNSAAIRTAVPRTTTARRTTAPCGTTSKVCGNAANLRASGARRRAAAHG